MGGLSANKFYSSLQAKSEEVAHVQATWEHHENSMIDSQLQLADLKLVLEAAQRAEAEAKAGREAAESQLASQSSELGRLRSRMAGAEAEMDDLRAQVRQQHLLLHIRCLALVLNSVLAEVWSIQRR